MKKLTIILALVLSLTLCVGALAEQPPAAETTETVQVETAAEQDFTKAAVDAYKALKKAAKVTKKLDALKEELDALKEELDAYVADGKLTQEQADLVLKYYTEKFSSQGAKDVRKEQPNGKSQQKQKNNAQTPNGKGGKRAKPADNGSSGVDTTGGATKKGK